MKVKRLWKEQNSPPPHSRKNRVHDVLLLWCVRIFSGFLLHFFRLNTTPHWIFWGNSRNLFLPCAKLAFISINFGFLFLCVCACGFYVSYAADISLHLTQSWFNKRKELCCISTILHFPPQPQTSATSRSRNFERKIKHFDFWWFLWA